MPYPTISLTEIRGAIDSALDDLYSDGIITAGVYKKKSAERFLLWGISNADRHVCLQIALSSIMAIYVPAGQKTIFLARQKEYVSEYLSQYSAIEMDDPQQYAYLVDDVRRLDIISVLSNYANIYSDIPVNSNPETNNALVHSLPQQFKDDQSGEKRFYVEPDQRKIVLNTTFSSPKWMEFSAQVAPISTSITDLTDSELSEYKIMAPYWTKDWLLFNAITRLLPATAANQHGFFDLESKARNEAFQNKPGTGNVIIPGDELDGNYEGNFNF